MVILDSTDGTAADRTQLWINGLRNTDVTLGTSPSENADMIWGSRDNMTIGAGHSGSAANANPYDGYFAEMHFIDGQKKASTDFGKFNDNGVWIPKKYSGTYGTNGWFMEFKQTGTSQNSSGIGADTSGNDNHFAVTNSVATDVTTDTPTNNFATLNPLMAGRSSTLSEGNLKVTGESDNTYDVATFGSSMKWYMEWKVDENFDGSGGGIRIGAIHVDDVQVAFGSLGNTTAKYYTNSNDGKTQFGGGNNETTGLTRATTNDIIMCACDGAGAKIWWGINGTWLNYGSGAGDPAAGNNAAPWTNAMKAGIWFPATVYSGTAASGTLNLGNPPNAISSSQADDNGYGNFEYDVPAGFYSLCTKNLAEFG
jgi:hypothetical protein